MSDITLRVVEAFPEPEISSLRREVFADFEPSALLTEVLAASRRSAERTRNFRMIRFALPPFEMTFSSAGHTGTAKEQVSSAC